MDTVTDPHPTLGVEPIGAEHRDWLAARFLHRSGVTHAIVRRASDQRISMVFAATGTPDELDADALHLAARYAATYVPAISERARVVAALRELAAFLEDNPTVPAPQYAEIVSYVEGANDVEAAAALGGIAALCGSPIKIVRPDEQAQMSTSIQFGAHQFGARLRVYRIAESPRRTAAEMRVAQAAAEGPAGDAAEEPQAAADEHHMVAGWKDDTDPNNVRCGAECACGMAVDGFATLDEASELLARPHEAPAGCSYCESDACLGYCGAGAVAADGLQ